MLYTLYIIKALLLSFKSMKTKEWSFYSHGGGGQKNLGTRKSVVTYECDATHTMIEMHMMVIDTYVFLKSCLCVTFHEL